MKRYYLAFFIVLFIGCSEDCPEIVEDLATSDLDIILVIGQSNTHYGLGLDGAIDTPDDRVFQLGRFEQENKKVIAGTEPLQHHSSQFDRIGFALTFAKQYVIDYLAGDGDRNVVIIPGGSGGTGFANNRWNKGDDLYEDAVDRTLYVLENYPNSRLEAILWHQGESDVGNSNYQCDLDQFINDIRQDLDAATVPFILGGMVPFWVNQAPIRIVQQGIISGTVDRIEVTGYADPTLPFVIEKLDNNYDGIHYEAAGMRELGQRYFQEYEELAD